MANRLLFLGILAATAWAADPPTDPTETPVVPPELTVPEAEGLAAFSDIYRVTQSPRCMNCHPAGDAPLQTDLSIPHSMGVTRNSVYVGLMCSTCHRSKGLGHTLPHLPPADPHWRMPDAIQGFQGRTEAELCRQLADPEQTGDRNLDALTEHVRTDHLLMTSWHSGRTPPPISHGALVKRFEAWAAAGGPCPSE